MDERWGLARWGRREIAICFATGLAVTLSVASLVGTPVWAVVPGVLTVLCVLFFRDPARRIPEGEGEVVAPADGKVVEITEVNEPEFIGGRALKIGIFLSVFDVHINRAPCEGRVRLIRYRQGKFLNALRQDAARLNENNMIGIDGGSCPVLVKQIAGVIARRIVCACREGDALARGEKLGMIKFGSRTELYIPVDAGFSLEVALGDRVRAGSSVLGTIR